MDTKEITIGSICAGAGGFDCGLKNIGFITKWAVDIMADAVKSFKANFPEANVLCKDAHEIKDFRVLGEVDGLVFGPPCQGFSLANTNRKVDDERNYVYLATLRAVEQLRPKFFIFENVKGLLSMNNENGGKFFDDILVDYTNCGDGYKLKWKLIDCVNVGVPQVNRERVIIVGIRDDINYEYEFPEEEYGPGKLPYVTLRDTIYHLRDLDQEGSIDLSGFSSQYLSRNRQKDWDSPSFTIEASGRQAKLHPDGGKMTKVGKNQWHIPSTCRKLSTLECKLIQTFPEDYIITGNLNKQYIQIGNAVPPKLAEYVSKPIFMFFNGL